MSVAGGHGWGLNVKVPIAGNWLLQALKWSAGLSHQRPTEEGGEYYVRRRHARTSCTRCSCGWPFSRRLTSKVSWPWSTPLSSTVCCRSDGEKAGSQRQRWR